MNGMYLVVKRRTYLKVAVTSSTVGLAGCGSSGGSGQASIEDTVIDADAENVIVRPDDLDSGWTGGLEEGSSSNNAGASYANGDREVSIGVNKHSDIESAEERFDNLQNERNPTLNEDYWNDVDYGNEGVLAKPTSQAVSIFFRGGNFTIGNLSEVSSSSIDPEDLARNMTEIMVGKIVDIQNS